MGGPDLRRVPPHHDHPRAHLTVGSDRHDEPWKSETRHRSANPREIGALPRKNHPPRTAKINKSRDQNASSRTGLVPGAVPPQGETAIAVAYVIVPTPPRRMATH